MNLFPQWLELMIWLEDMLEVEQKECVLNVVL